MRHRACVLVAACVLMSCSDGADDTGTRPNVDWELPPIYGVANIDDDDSNGVPDGEESIVEGENDLSALVLDPDIWSWAGDATVALNSMRFTPRASAP